MQAVSSQAYAKFHPWCSITCLQARNTCLTNSVQNICSWLSWQPMNGIEDIQIPSYALHWATVKLAHNESADREHIIQYPFFYEIGRFVIAHYGCHSHDCSKPPPQRKAPLHHHPRIQTRPSHTRRTIANFISRKRLSANDFLYDKKTNPYALLLFWNCFPFSSKDKRLNSFHQIQHCRRYYRMPDSSRCATFYHRANKGNNPQIEQHVSASSPQEMLAFPLYRPSTYISQHHTTNRLAIPELILICSGTKVWCPQFHTHSFTTIFRYIYSIDKMPWRDV